MLLWQLLRIIKNLSWYLNSLDSKTTLRNIYRIEKHVLNEVKSQNLASSQLMHEFNKIAEHNI